MTTRSIWAVYINFQRSMKGDDVFLVLRSALEGYRHSYHLRWFAKEQRFIESDDARKTVYKYASAQREAMEAARLFQQMRDA
ncbi:MAG: hypothetical protein RR053_05690 [Evtepia sp.]